jgi:hypothetical protein
MVKNTTKSLKIKERYKLSNWPEYNRSLKNRGSLTIWFEEGVKNNWLFNGKQKPGGQKVYSDLAIEFCLTIRSLFRLPYRQTEGMVNSLMKLASLELPVPSYTQFNRRTKHIQVSLNSSNESIHIAVDSSGLKVFGEGEWVVRKYGWSKMRTWRKLNLAINIETLTIEAATLTGNEADDASQVAPLLNAIKGKVLSCRGDGAYDKKKVRKVLWANDIRQIIPPKQQATIENKPFAGERNTAIQRIRASDIDTWKSEIDYHKRSLVEVSMYRYKTIFTGILQSRKIEYEQKEVLFKCKLLNRMADLGMPKSYKSG